MPSIKKLLLLVLALNALIVVVFFTVAPSEESSLTEAKVQSTQDLFTQKEPNKKSSKKSTKKSTKKSKTESSDGLSEAFLEKLSQDDEEKDEKEAQPESSTYKKPDLKMKRVPHKNYPPVVNPLGPVQQFTRRTNPFYLLGAYPEPNILIPFERDFEKKSYDKVKFGFYNDDDYCERVDYYNLAHPKNMFRKQNQFSDYPKNSAPRIDVMPKVGNDVMPNFSKYSKDKNFKNRTNHFDITITNFFINTDNFHKFHEIGKHFLCATQMFNHIPGHRALVRKDEMIESIDRYTNRFLELEKPQCFNSDMFFPKTYRLYRLGECEAFFNKINSQEYNDSLKTEPLQFMIKVSHNSHAGEGVFLLDDNQTNYLNTEYINGTECGLKDNALIAQRYISNSLLLDLGNKFDFRIFMLVASTNPLIAYYHDGVLRVSLSSFDKFDTTKSKHLTNTHLAMEIFEQAKKKKVNGMTEAELKEYHHWSFTDLQDYLLESGKITDKNWLDTHLRPQFKKALVHIIKMTSEHWWKGSNVYGLFGVDFMLDEEMNLWFIEANPNPQLTGVTVTDTPLFKDISWSLFEVMYSLYKSRMERIMNVIFRMKKEKLATGSINYKKYKEEYQEASKNKFEPHYEISAGNTFSLFMDESRPGAEAYFGSVSEECAGYVRDYKNEVY